MHRRNCGSKVGSSIACSCVVSYAQSLTVAIALICGSQSSAETAMIAYGKAGTGAIQPKYRIWNGTAWGAESSANSLGSVPQWLVLRGSPVNNECVLLTLDNSNDIEGQHWN